jgi:hypothetical protein
MHERRRIPIGTDAFHDRGYRVRRVVVARTAEPRQRTRHGERSLGAGVDPEHGGGQPRRDREAAVQVEMPDARDVEVDVRQQVGGGPAHARQLVEVRAIGEKPQLGDVGGRPRPHQAILRHAETAAAASLASTSAAPWFT